MQITALDAPFGAEITGLDLNVPVPKEQAKRLNQALLQKIVLVIRDQNLTPKAYSKGVSVFGKPMLQHRLAFRLPECPEVSRIINREMIFNDS